MNELFSRLPKDPKIFQLVDYRVEIQRYDVLSFIHKHSSLMSIYIVLWESNGNFKPSD